MSVSAVTSTSPRDDLMAKQLEYFRRCLEASLPLTHFSKFYDSAEMNAAILDAIRNTLSEFEPSLSRILTMDKLPEVLNLPEYQSEIARWEVQFSSINESHREQSLRFIDSMITNECFVYETSIVASLSQSQPQNDMDLEEGKSEALSRMKSSWKYGNLKFQEESIAELERRLEEIKSRYGGRGRQVDETGTGEGVADPIPVAENALGGRLAEGIDVGDRSQLDGMPTLFPANDPNAHEEETQSQSNSRVVFMEVVLQNDDGPYYNESLDRDPLDIEYPVDRNGKPEDGDDGGDSGASTEPPSPPPEVPEAAPHIMQVRDEPEIVPLLKKRRKSKKWNAATIPHHIRKLPGEPTKYKCFKHSTPFSRKNISLHVNCIKTENEYPYVCEQCKRKYRNLSYYTRHFKNFHGSL